MYIIHIEGFKEEEARSRVADRMSDVFSLPRMQVQKMLDRLPTVFRRVISIDEAAKLVGALDKIGLLIRLEKEAALSPEDRSRIVACPVCKNDQIKSARCLYCGEPFEKPLDKTGIPAPKPKPRPKAEPPMEKRPVLGLSVREWGIMVGLVLVVVGVSQFLKEAPKTVVVEKPVLPTSTPGPEPLDPSEVDGVYARALDSIDKGDLNAAASDLARVVLTRPDFYDAHRHLSEVYQEMGRYSDEAKVMEAMNRLRPENEVLLLRIARLNLEKEISPQRAFQILKKLYQQNPNQPEVLDLIAFSYFKNGNLRLARTWILKARSEDSASEEIGRHYDLIVGQWEKRRIPG